VRLCTAPHDWAVPLWHCIRPLQPLDKLLTALQAGRPITLCSDASVDAGKNSCCAWTIHTTADLWHGEGIVPGHKDDTYSGRSEAFGILTALMFLTHYTSLHPSTTPMSASPVIVYCDSESVLTRIRQHLSATTTYPNSTAADDYDIYCTIAHTVKQMQPLVPAFRHVKGHQDKNTRRRPPTLPEQLNIDCD